MKQKIILVDYNDCTTRYFNTHGNRDLEDQLKRLKEDTAVEYIEVFEGRSTHLWSNPNSSPED